MKRTPAKMWSILEDLYSRVGDDGEAGQTLFEEFWTEQFQKYKTIEEYGAKLKTYQDQLANITERRLTDRNLIFQLMKGLPPQYDGIVTIIRMNRLTITIEAIQLPPIPGYLLLGTYHPTCYPISTMHSVEHR